MQEWLQQALVEAQEHPQFREKMIPDPVPGRVALVDGDYLCYWAAGNDDTDPGIARRVSLDRIESAMVMSGATRAVVHMTAAGSHKAHRYLIASIKPYQGQRSGRKPRNWAFLRQFLEGYSGERFKVKLWAEREADDGIALYAHETLRRGRPPPVILSADKDMRMLPGIHLNWKTWQMTTVRPWEWDVPGKDGLQYGIRWFFLQLLQGDPADNIPGLPEITGKSGIPVRCGPRTAEKMLADNSHDRATQVVISAYRGLYGAKSWADALAEQAALLWLRTDAGARLGDWLLAFPERYLLGEQWPDLLAAQERMTQRVQKGLGVLKEVGCSA